MVSRTCDFSSSKCVHLIALPATGWETCEFRTYAFTSTKRGDDALMMETRRSRTARGLRETDPIPSQEEQEQLYLQTMQKWDDCGFQNPLKIEEK
jgi:hypothetical protein